MNLRPMLMDDADFLLSLKNMPETRRYSIVSKEEIKRENHLEYLKENLEYFQVIQDSQHGGSVITPVGVVRIKDNEISLWLHRDWWGNGIATWIIRLVSEKGMTAKIVNGNIGSLKAFINAGFKPISYQDNYYIFQK